MWAVKSDYADDYTPQQLESLFSEMGINMNALNLATQQQTQVRIQETPVERSPRAIPKPPPMKASPLTVKKTTTTSSSSSSTKPKLDNKKKNYNKQSEKIALPPAPDARFENAPMFIQAPPTSSSQDLTRESLMSLSSNLRSSMPTSYEIANTTQLQMSASGALPLPPMPPVPSLPTFGMPGSSKSNPTAAKKEALKYTPKSFESRPRQAPQNNNMKQGAEEAEISGNMMQLLIAGFLAKKASPELNEVIDNAADLELASGTKEGRAAFQSWRTAKLGIAAHNYLTRKSRAKKQLKSDFLTNVIQYVQEHPRASQADIQDIVQREVASFTLKMAALR